MRRVRLLPARVKNRGRPSGSMSYVDRGTVYDVRTG